MNFEAGTVQLLWVIGFFSWIIIGWLVVLLGWNMGGMLAMVIHDIPWAGWLIFAVAILLWPIAPWAVIPIAYFVEFIRKK